jgi:hypothetical protein
MPSTGGVHRDRAKPCEARLPRIDKGKRGGDADIRVSARAIMTPDNCVAETERLIASALRSDSATASTACLL